MIWLRRLLALPVVLISYAVVLFVHLAWGRHLWWERGVLMTRLAETSWPSRTWYRRWGGTAFGHGVMLAHAADVHVIEHELVHVEQIESNTVAGLVIGLAFVWASPFTLLLWPLTPLVCYLSGMLVAVLHGKNAYRGNHLEAAAYDATGPR